MGLRTALRYLCVGSLLSLAGVDAASADALKILDQSGQLRSIRDIPTGNFAEVSLTFRCAVDKCDRSTFSLVKTVSAGSDGDAETAIGPISLRPQSDSLEVRVHEVRADAYTVRVSSPTVELVAVRIGASEPLPISRRAVYGAIQSGFLSDSGQTVVGESLELAGDDQ